MKKYTRSEIAKLVDEKKPVPISLVPQILQSRINFKIGYTGLMYYRNLGLIPPPVRKGKEACYVLNPLIKRLQVIPLISSMFERNYSDIAKLAKKLPEDTFNKLPFAFMKLYSDAFPIDTISHWGYRFFAMMFWKMVEEASERARDITAEQFYYKVLKNDWNTLISGGSSKMLLKNI